MSQPRRAMIHTRVEMELTTEAGDKEPLVVKLADGRAANLDEGWLDIESPLGRAIRGQPEGALIPYKMGDIVALHILKVETVEPPCEDAAARRQAILDAARAKSERTTQEIFSSTYGSKWGAYHAEELEGSDSRADDSRADDSRADDSGADDSRAEK